MYKTILFDLDGTLTDPGVGITNSVMYALKKWNISVKDKSELYKFIGPPLIDAFEEFYGFSNEDSVKALAYYREYFSVKGLFENEVYEGIEDLLGEIKASGKKIVLATSKPEEYAVKILKHFSLYDYFDFVAGATMDETRNNKEAVLLYAIENFPIKDLNEALMIGDRKHDILGAKHFGIDSVGVLYGYGSHDELKTAGATYLAKTVEDIKKFL